jgi:hypothetical protein
MILYCDHQVHRDILIALYIVCLLDIRKICGLFSDLADINLNYLELSHAHTWFDVMKLTTVYKVRVFRNIFRADWYIELIYVW